ncbi:tRNA (adenosine(37)-N6)-dimethylallyltransferase MiaA [Novosphingobium sp. MMS21-SN21R]|uniref:tRNA (adenosine(37)-N6)-dimethylallyltransferase MiaA n=1 Tax=Novosphingobium sp. MMS21-SN21R TaxID=2969298 RepID=UPI002883E78E|nr:tRNA (adenosine(37)-N6)-dimethylallyltransferase MiaA [Novosphingobium sp. MMS21-SN21R]MDT0507817.1 tRNA (adenosine(37)-N6)-dimethylallyltransferase MiaA [Novosphingobium sp. MMS21-SN21R]
MITGNSFEGESVSPAAGRPRLALIAGPTASGKSDLAVKLALRAVAHGQEAVIINADSAQVYADLRVLSARPSEDEMQGVPHVLFGAWDGAQACSAADWANAAKREIAVAHARGALPILVGGTGLYIRTLLDGIAPVPEIDPEVRAAIRALPLELAYSALKTEDPERAALLAPADTQRITRALEVVRSTGSPLAHWQQRLSGGIGAHVNLAPLVLLPERQWLYRRCDLRFELMWQGGALEEVEALLARDLPDEMPVMRAIGVPEIRMFSRGNISQNEAIAAGQQATRRYAKRQYTWARNQNPGDWPRLEYENSIDSHHAASLLRI